uniref:Uncharacterized protein n=1 Tax=Rhizophora mucronata TaxID=61149 RepID=A0A2P2QU97_RHIMU
MESWQMCIHAFVAFFKNISVFFEKEFTEHICFLPWQWHAQLLSIISCNFSSYESLTV